VKKELAETLLAKIMDWSDKDKARERARLETLASYKYDEYQQFSPGRRFIESLALWLAQFDAGDERRIAYDFVCDRLIFFNAAEINHLVELTFPTIVRPQLIRTASQRSGIPADRIKAIIDAPEYQTLHRRTLYLGMSDGARTDWFRRANPSISNEQVFHAYDVSQVKTANMLGKLKKDLAKLTGAAPTGDEALFESVVLIDDFTASGTSAIRFDPTDGWDGKIPNILKALADPTALGACVVDGVKVTIVAYIASDQAIHHIQDLLPKLPFEKGEARFEVVCRLGPDVPLDRARDAAFYALMDDDRYFDTEADDEHNNAAGGATKRYGYANGRLPVVLNHNTPNNSVYVLWAEDVHTVRGLFPRVSRHRKLQQP
jgi:hypothetical protein